MGSFFTNVHVHAPTDAGAALIRIENALLRQAKRDGMVVADDGEPADRTLLLRAADGWISVYDEATENQDTDELDALAKALSLATGTHAFSVVVHDSDILELRLFHAGKRLDRYNSAPDYFGPVSARARKATAGEPELWAPLLSSATPSDLAALWSSEKLRPETKLADTARLFALDPERTGTGYRYIVQDADTDTDADTDAFIRLAFRYEDRPGYDVDAEGPPSFEVRGFSERVEVSTGYTQQRAWAVRNAGGASRGFRIFLWGDALERQLVTVTAIHVVVGSPAPENRHTVAATPTASGGLLFDFPDVPIPAGASDLGATMRLPPDKMVEVLYRSNIRASFEFHGETPGEGTLGVGFVAAVDADIQHGFEARVVVTPAPSRPARAEPDADPALLRALETPTTLCALVSLDLPRAEAARRVAPIIERWSERLGTGEATVTILPTSPQERPTVRRALSTTWPSLATDLENSRRVTAVLDRDDDSEPRQLGSGFVFGVALYDPSATEDDPELPTLGLWTPAADTTNNDTNDDDNDDDDNERLLIELMDELMIEHHGVQAIVCRWDWAPDEEIESTPYELVCGVYGGTLRRSYLRAHLRAVTRGVFWGTDGARAAIDELRALGGSTEVTEIAPGRWRATVRE